MGFWSDLFSSEPEPVSSAYEECERTILDARREATEKGERRFDIEVIRLCHYDYDDYNAEKVCKKHGLKIRKKWNESREHDDEWIEW